jgi:hypothetical protein
MSEAEQTLPTRPPHCCGKLCADGEWRVLMIVPLASGHAFHSLLDADEAECLARQLNEYAQMIRERTGLPGGREF